MSEKTTRILKPEEVQQEQVEAVEEQAPQAEEMAGKILNYFVGIQGSAVYRLSSNAEVLDLRDHIEAIATIETNTVAALFEGEDPLKAIQLYADLKKEIVAQSVNAILDLAEAPEEEKEAIRSIFK
jgi:predicted flavoprotein YhiN